MLRPATPLSIIFFLAFVLLLLSTLSTPVIKGIPLGSFQGWNFGVLGYCKGDTGCEGPLLGYSTDGLFSGDSAEQFSLPSSTRHSLSSILIVHPVAALLTLICFGLAVAAHFHAPSHSPRYLLALLILTVPTLLVTLLAFLVDILLFVPHMAWGGWIVLAATILIIASSVVTCAMRRTLVSRKARKKRIEENAEMSGANYYENMAQTRAVNNTVPPPVMSQDSQLPRAESPPPMSGTTMGEKNAQYAAFEMKRQNTGTRSRDGDGMGSPMDDRAPLNPTPSMRSGSTGRGGPYMNGEMPPPMPMAGRPSMDSQGRPRRPSRDDYGNPLPPPVMRHQGSQGSLGSQGSFASRGRGRGGYGPPPRGQPGSSGGYGPPRGSYGSRGSYRGGPPPPGWNGRGRGGYGPPPGAMAMGMRAPPPRQPPPGYANDPYYGGPPPGPRSGASPTMERAPDPYVAGPDMPIGMAIEMDERTGSPPVMNPPPGGPMSPNYGLRDSDADINGMVGLQQNMPSPMRSQSERETDHRSPSVYSQEAYFPPRQQWNHPTPLTQGGEPGEMSSNSHFASSGTLPPNVASPPVRNRARGDSGSYYEDVDPRFAVEENTAPPSALTPGGMPPGAISHGIPCGYPATPGAPYNGQRMQSPSLPPQNPSYLHPSYAGAGSGGAVGANDVSPSSDQPHLSGSSSLMNNGGVTPNGGSSQEDLPEGARSPGQGSERASEASHFTSISQRPVNPNWRPAGGPMGGSTFAPPPPASSASAVQRRRDDVILNGNPDFSIPGVGLGGRGGRGGMRGRGGQRGSVPPSVGLTPGGRYPTDM